MQTNPNWLAFFIITDPSPFEKRLSHLLKGYNDPRLIYHDVPLSHRPVVREIVILFLFYVRLCAVFVLYLICVLILSGLLMCIAELCTIFIGTYLWN